MKRHIHRLHIHCGGVKRQHYKKASQQQTYSTDLSSQVPTSLAALKQHQLACDPFLSVCAAGLLGRPHLIWLNCIDFVSNCAFCKLHFTFDMKAQKHILLATER